MTEIDLEVWKPGGWQRIGSARIEDSRGLLGHTVFQYDTTFVATRGSVVEDELKLNFEDQASTHLTGGLFDIHIGSVVNAVLRDIIPSGWGREHLCQKLGLPRGPAADRALLLTCSYSPIGNMRVACSEATPWAGFSFTRQELSNYGPETLDLDKTTNVPCWAGLGAGGDAPKLLIAEGSGGELYLDGTEPRDRTLSRWLVKFPRGGRAADRDILRSEYIFTKTLKGAGLDCAEVHWLEDGAWPSLWIRRFDQQPDGTRQSVESAYSLMRTIGDGAKLNHHDVLSTVLPLAANRDALLAEYLIRDRVNGLIGNTDNHGRNMAFFRTGAGLNLAPAYDLAPMVADPAGISRATVWNAGDTYEDVVSRHADNTEYVWNHVKEVTREMKDAIGSARENCPKTIRENPCIFRSPTTLP